MKRSLYRSFQRNIWKDKMKLLGKKMTCQVICLLLTVNAFCHIAWDLSSSKIIVKKASCILILDLQEINNDHNKLGKMHKECLVLILKFQSKEKAYGQRCVVVSSLLITPKIISSHQSCSVSLGIFEGNKEWNKNKLQNFYILDGK